MDWITNKLYWTDTGQDIINVLDLNTNIRKTLIDVTNGTTNAAEPRAIAIDPFTRLGIDHQLLLHSQNIWQGIKFGGLGGMHLNSPFKISDSQIFSTCMHVIMAIPYHTTKFKSPIVLKMSFGAKP